MLDDEAEDEELEQNDEGSWLPSVDAGVRPYVVSEWQRYLSSVRERSLTDDQLRAARGLIKELFDALHSNTLFGVDDAKKEERPRYYWHHQQFVPIQTRDATRGFDIDRGALLRLAADYLSKSEIRTDRLDWILLDAIVFQELDAYAEHVLSTRGGTGINWAAAFASNSELKYYGLSLLFWIVGFALNYIAPPALIYYLYTHDHQLAATIVLGVWALLLLWRLATFPFRWRARRKAVKLLAHLIELYNQLGGNTITPTRWKKTLEAATADGVALDGAVFTIIDRAIVRDPTAFLPHQSA